MLSGLLVSVLFLAPAASASPPVAAAPQAPEAPAVGKRARVPANLLRPLPTKGGIPRMVPEHRRPGTPEQWARYDATFAAVKSRSFAGTATTKARDAGLETVRSSVDPASFESMYGALRGQKHDVLLAVLDAFAKGGTEGQFALASVAIQDPDAAIRAEATRRLQQPPSDAVLAAIDDGLRSTNHDWIDRAGILAGATHAVEAIPALIFAQSANTSDGTERGDRAWIAIGRTISYVQNVVPVVGDNAAGFQPVIGQLIEGVVMQVQDCVVTIYHGGVHDSLVAMTTYDSGSDTGKLAWDMRAWARWFNETYVPLKQREDKELAAAAQAAAAAAP
jgi:hypothetical protein